MTRRHWIALLVVAAIVAVVALLHPCGDVVETPRPTMTETPNPSVAPVAADPAAKPTRRPAAHEDAPKQTTDDAPPPATAHATVVVHVVAEPDKKPVAGVEVLLVEDSSGRDEVEHRAPTDAAGVARFDVPPGSVSVRASGPDWVRSDFTGGTVEAGEDRSFELALERGVSLAGVVLDARTGRPIAGAAVEVILGGAIDGFGSSGTSAPPLANLVTGEDGRFRLRVPADELVTPTASARAFVAGGKTVIVPAGDRPRPALELRLEPAGSLRGTVRAPNGTAVAGATVSLRRADKPSDDPMTSTTDATGRYELDGLTLGGAYIASAAADGWAPSVCSSGVLVTDDAPTADVDFTLRKFGAVVVHVVDSVGGKAQVSVASDSTETRVMDADADGNARLEQVCPGPVLVVVASTGLPSQSATAELSEGATAEVTVRLERGVVLAGVVVDDRGDPVAGARLFVRRPWNGEGADLPASNGEATSGADGSFRVEPLRSGPHFVTLIVNGHEALIDRRASAPTQDLRLAVTRCGSAKVRVVVSEGHAPPTDLKVFSERLADFTTAQGDEIWGGSGAAAEVGQPITLPQVGPGACRVRVTSNEFAATIRKFQAVPGETVDLGDLVLDPGIDVIGRVEDVHGAPVEGAHISFGERALSAYVDVTTAADGGFRIARLAKGRNPLRVAAADFVTSTIEVEVVSGAAPLVVRLPRGGVVRVSVVDATGAPVVGATVEIRAAGAAPSARPAASGPTDFRGVDEERVAPGKYRVTVEGKDAAADVEVVEGADAAVRLVVK